jgi:hypothetical protein
VRDPPDRRMLRLLHTRQFPSGRGRPPSPVGGVGRPRTLVPPLTHAAEFVEPLAVLLGADLVARVALREDLAGVVERVVPPAAPPDEEPPQGDRTDPEGRDDRATSDTPSRSRDEEPKMGSSSTSASSSWPAVAAADQPRAKGPAGAGPFATR